MVSSMKKSCQQCIYKTKWFWKFLTRTYLYYQCEERSVNKSKRVLSKRVQHDPFCKMFQISNFLILIFNQIWNGSWNKIETMYRKKFKRNNLSSALKSNHPSLYRIAQIFYFNFQYYQIFTTSFYRRHSTDSIEQSDNYFFQW